MLFSIITVVYNDVKNVSSTIESVSNQSFSDFELIVVDGGSNDGTLDKIKCHNEQIAKYVSEKDEGIYDAMNKGVGMASGKWVIFINSGDRFHDPDVLGTVATTIKNHGEADIIYGDHVNQYSDYLTNSTADRPLETIWKKLPFSHQAAFVRRDLLLEFPFNLEYQITADHENFFSLWFRKHHFFRLKRFIAIVELGGLSDKQRVLSYRERIRFLKSYGVKGFKIFLLRVIVFKETIKAKFKKLIGHKMINKFIYFRNRWSGIVKN